MENHLCLKSLDRLSAMKKLKQQMGSAHRSWTSSLRLWLNIYHETALGLAFTLSLVLLGIYTVLIGAKKDTVVTVYIPVRLPTAAGLSKGSDVFIHGVPAGYIDSLYYMSLDQQGWPLPFDQEAQATDQTVIALVALQAPPRFYPNYRVVSRYRTALADKVLDFFPGGAADWFNAENAPGQPYPWPQEIAWDEPIAYLQLDLQQVSQFRRSGLLPRRLHLLTASNYMDPLYLLAAVLDENRPPLYQSLLNLRQITDKINYGRGNIALFINRPDLAYKLNAILEEAILLVADLRDGLENQRESRSMTDLLSVIYILAIDILLQSLPDN